MLRILFDIETNGLLEDTTTLHCLATINVDTGERLSFADQPGYRPLKEGLALLQKADWLIGHNIICFDIPALRKLYPFFNPKAYVFDTLNASRLIWPEIKEQVDFKLLRKGIAPGPWMGRHSLGSWGIRLRCPKDDYAERMKKDGLDPWAAWNPLMHEYCKQDVETNLKLFELIISKEYAEEALRLEMEFQEVIAHQERNGFPFNEKAAHRLYALLVGRKMELERQLLDRFQPWYRPDKEFIPKADNKRFGYRKGAPMTKVILTEFNPSSREHIADRFQKILGWVPTEFSETGKPTVSETVLESLDFPEAKLCAEYLMITKRLGQLAEGDNAWLKLVRNGRIHGRVITNGTVTGRCTHKSPNVAQVPSVGSPYGEECRSLFYALPGFKQVGCDASGLELRILAHYMARYDGGAYGEELLKGDIHTANQMAAGLPTRSAAKTFIYAFLYGSGPVNLGSIVAPTASEEEQRKIGTKMINSFLRKTPALKRLREDVKNAVKKRGYLVGLDGRHLHIRSSHSALNALFQSAGSIVVKKATVFLFRKLQEAGYEIGKDVMFVAHVHDEYQLHARADIAEHVGQLGVEAIREAGEYFNLRIPLDGEYKVGANWAETH